MIYTQLADYIREDTGVSLPSVRATLDLIAEGATIPFIARYRKEKPGGIDETQIKQIQTRHDYYQSLFERQETVLNAIIEQGKLSDSLKLEIEACRDKQRLEDLYLPYKQRRKTKADIADENGLTPLADLILAQREMADKHSVLSRFVSSTGPVSTPELALEGALHIISQRISDDAQHRQGVRDMMLKSGVLRTTLSKKFKDTKTKFDMYADFSEPLRSAASHRLLAIRRGEKEGVLD
jgi:protein Tex